MAGGLQCTPLEGRRYTSWDFGLGVAMHAIGRHWVGMPDPGGVYFGITLFMCTLWYSLGGVGPFPFREKLAPWENGLFGWGVIMTLTILLFLAFVNFNGLPIQDHRTDPHGQIAAQEWFDRCVWIIVWIQAFGSIMCFQGWPFVLLKTPWYQISQLAVCIGLGTACWEVTLAAEIDQPTSASAVGATMISFSLYHAIGFELRPFASRFVQPMRGLCNFLLEEIVCTVIWVFLCRGILEPVADRLVDAGPPYSFFNVNHLTAWYSLHVVAPLLIIHENFFARFPMDAPAGPPIGPFELAGAKETESNSEEDLTARSGAMEQGETQKVQPLEAAQLPTSAVDHGPPSQAGFNGNGPGPDSFQTGPVVAGAFQYVQEHEAAGRGAASVNGAPHVPPGQPTAQLGGGFSACQPPLAAGYGVWPVGYSTPVMSYA